MIQVGRRRVIRRAMVKAVSDPNFKPTTHVGTKRGHPTLGEYDEVRMVKRRLAPGRQPESPRKDYSLARQLVTSFDRLDPSL
jgi:hypothetical protein